MFDHTFNLYLWNKRNAVLSCELNFIVHNEHVLKGTKDVIDVCCDCLTESLMTTLDKVACLHVFLHISDDKHQNISL